jgi:hypothetical protein
MAHFAEIDENNLVLRILVVDNEKENKGQEFLADELGLGGTWVQTSYNTRAGIHLFGGVALRKNFAGIGFTYDEALDAFIPPKCHDEAELDTDTCNWNCTNESHKEPSQ